MSLTFESKITDARGILFDLDNTLYPREKGVFDRINDRIDSYVMSLTGLDLDGVKRLRRSYIDRHGTTLGGLMAHHGVPPAEFLEFVHDIPLADLLHPDEVLRDLLSRIELPKVVFTNASAGHAERVMETLTIDDQFDGICALEATGYQGKPHREAYLTAVGMLDCPVTGTILIDDLDVNVKAGTELGMMTVYIGMEPMDGADLVLPRVVDMAGHLRGVGWFKG